MTYTQINKVLRVSTAATHHRIQIDLLHVGFCASIRRKTGGALTFRYICSFDNIAVKKAAEDWKES
jgi:hypothetical protein